ncbi:MAG: MFS transporter [Turicibacter sp.]|nr:MFS transporter [Turicibacter sp. TS3]MCI8701931.1 MFS transporter [Turicibacter sp.]MCI9351389.1 MFS transporter [Turicibacter sp.]
MWQLKVPSTIRGEMNGMMTTLTWGMIPLGSFLAAVFAPFISYAWMIVIA